MSVRVLVCDDHELIRYAVRECLSIVPDIAVIGEAQEGATAVQLARSLAPDVVIMDVVMPGMNGIEATRQLVASAPRPQVLALSADADWNQVVAMIAAGASGYLLKAWSMCELAQAIRAVAAGETYLSGAIGLLARNGPLDASFRSLFASHFKHNWRLPLSPLL